MAIANSPSWISAPASISHASAECGLTLIAWLIWFLASAMLCASIALRAPARYWAAESVRPAMRPAASMAKERITRIIALRSPHAGPHRSEDKLQAELQLAHIVARGADLAEGALG